MTTAATNALKAVATGKPPATTKPATIAGLMSDPKIKQQMALALPKHMTADRLARIALTEVRKVPALANCDQASFLGAIMQCAQLGLEPGGALGHAYLLPFENRRKQITEVQFILGYRGMLDLARRSGQIKSIEARAVYQADKFHVRLGLDPDLTHEPDWENADRGLLRFVYAVAKLQDGGTQFDVMSRAEIEKVRAQSKAGQAGPWVSHFEEMAKKTVIRRLFKYLPVSIEVARAVGLDEQSEAGLPQDNPLTDGMTIDNDTGEITGGSADSAGGSVDTVFDPALMLDRIAKCTDIAVLQMIADDVDYMPAGPAKTNLQDSIALRDKELAK
jgi:recombination protein RecT